MIMSGRDARGPNEKRMLAAHLGDVAGTVDRHQGYCAPAYHAPRCEVRRAIGRLMMSMKTEAAPSAPARSPSSKSASKTSRPPSSLGDFSTTTASDTPALALLNTETVALGGVVAKLSAALSLHSSGRWMVSAWPAERIVRSAEMVAL